MSFYCSPPSFAIRGSTCSVTKVSKGLLDFFFVVSSIVGSFRTYFTFYARLELWKGKESRDLSFGLGTIISFSFDSDEDFDEDDEEEDS